MVRFRGHCKGFGDPFRYALFGSPLLVQVHMAVHPPHPFEVPDRALLPEPMKALPEAPAAVVGHHGIQDLDHREVAFKLLFFGIPPVPIAPREPGDNIALAIDSPASMRVRAA